MRKQLLRGMLLGLGITLLLAGGVAMAQEPVCEGTTAAQGEHEEFGDGWSRHWTDEDNVENGPYCG